MDMKNTVTSDLMAWWTGDGTLAWTSLTGDDTDDIDGSEEDTEDFLDKLA